MGSPFEKLKKGLGNLLETQALKSELNAVQQRREQALQRLGEGIYRLIEDGLMQPLPATKEAYLDARALTERVQQLKKLLAQGYAGPVPPPPAPAPDLGDEDFETRPASQEEGPLGEEPAAAPAGVRAALGTCVCGAVLPAGAKYCTECGMPVERPKKTIAPARKCPHCKADIPHGVEFCPKCGSHADQEVYEV
jgi:ribosomal protein L40E